MNGWVLRWGLSILAIIITAILLPGFELTLWAAIVGSIFLGIVNATIRPLIIVLTLPLNVLSLGLLTFVINGLMLWVTSVTIRGFDLHSFWWAVLAAIDLSIINFIINYFIEDGNKGFR
ncbi:MAG: phage holin family protein [Syntrophomonadaceae bacterium]|nr:phage holin family protein [Syntrophomonadaceae bacterium]